MSISQNSRNNLAATISVINPTTGVLQKPAFLDIRKRVSDADPEDRFVTVNDGHTWANLGLTRLEDANAWWAIADLSGVVDPFVELERNTQLRVPTVHRFLFRILGGDE